MPNLYKIEINKNPVLSIGTPKESIYILAESFYQAIEHIQQERHKIKDFHSIESGQLIEKNIKFIDASNN